MSDSHSKKIGADLYQVALLVAEHIVDHAAELGAVVDRRPSGIRLVDCRNGTHDLGRQIISFCGSGRLKPSLVKRPLVGHADWTHVAVETIPGTTPTKTLLGSQFAGRQFAIEQGGKTRWWMGSGPARSWGDEAMWHHLGLVCETEPLPALWFLEGGKMPTDETLATMLAKTPNLIADGSIVLVAPTDCIPCHVQVPGRNLEVGLHKYHNLGGDPWGIKSMSGFAPLPPAQTTDDFIAMGRTNDGIIYAGEVTFVFDGNWADIEPLASKCTSIHSAIHGTTFCEALEAVGRDFNKVDPAFFAPAVSHWAHVSEPENILRTYGRVDETVLRTSWGL